MNIFVKIQFHLGIWQQRYCTCDNLMTIVIQFLAMKASPKQASANLAMSQFTSVL